MNIQETKKISFRVILESFSIFPVEKTSRYAMYYSVERDERIASLSLYIGNNTLFDHGSQKKYDQISLVQAIKKVNVSEALSYLRDLTATDYLSIDTKNIQNTKKVKDIKDYEIIISKPVEHPALIQYLTSRKIHAWKGLLCEIHYKSNESKFFGVGFKNDSGGYEFRNPFQKICLAVKDITTFIEGNEKIVILESFSDFLSYKSMFPNKDTDFVVLNSVGMLSRSFKILKNYKEINVFLDNDESASKATNTLIEKFNAVDHRSLYKQYHDLNDFLVSKNLLRSGRNLK